MLGVLIFCLGVAVFNFGGAQITFIGTIERSPSWARPAIAAGALLCLAGVILGLSGVSLGVSFVVSL